MKFRHFKGRTFGGAGTKTKNAFVTSMSLIIATSKTDQAKRDGIIQLLENELALDVAQMLDVIRDPSKHLIVWKDILSLPIDDSDKQIMIKKQQDRISAGEAIIKNQNLKPLAERR